jgi:hypothetical protein
MGNNRIGMGETMAGPIAKVVRSPRACALIREFEAMLPEGTAVFIVAVGGRDPRGGREVCLGGHTGNIAARQCAADVLNPAEPGVQLISMTLLKDGLN